MSRFIFIDFGPVVEQRQEGWEIFLFVGVLVSLVVFGICLFDWVEIRIKDRADRVNRWRDFVRAVDDELARPASLAIEHLWLPDEILGLRAARPPLARCPIDSLRRFA
jgi:hypothetical protein